MQMNPRGANRANLAFDDAARNFEIRRPERRLEGEAEASGLAASPAVVLESATPIEVITAIEVTAPASSC